MNQSHAEKVFLEQKRDETVLALEAERVAAAAAKTAKLRKLRLAKEAAERKAASAKPRKGADK